MLTLFIGCLVSPGEYELLLEDAQDADDDGDISEVYGGADCDDADHAIHSRAQELCDQIDNDCDGLIDEGIATQAWYLDADRDGFGDLSTAVDRCSAPEDHVLEPGDCDDSEDDVNPDAEEICNDGIDNDCDGGAPECAWGGTYDLALADAVIRSESGLDYFGLTLAVVDANGDGTDEVAIGAPFRDSDEFSDAGVVYLFSNVTGSHFAHEEATWQVPGTESGAGLGLYSLGLSDFNGDGYGDLAVGGDDRYGAVHVWTGSAAGYSQSPQLTFTAPESGRTSWGEGMASIQVEDGTTGLAIGAPDASIPALYLWFDLVSATNPASSADLVVEGEGIGESLSSTASGDLDGDGQGDLVLTLEDRDIVALGYGPLPRGVIPVADLGRQLHAEGLEPGTGPAVGDFDGDGYDDGVFADISTGTLYLHHGSASREWADHIADTDVVIETGYEGGGLVMSAGSLVSETDLLVTVPRYVEDNWQGTLIQVFSSPISVDSSPAVTATGDGRYCGFGVATADLNGDNAPDLIVSCPLAEDRGLAYIQFGRTL
ncbi:MAG: MopE-related protein [Myxococcota bacterium]|nr:MopE-related protein [Myxococcota bacterium]